MRDLTDAERSQVDAYKRDWATAHAKGDTAGEEKAHANADKVRASAGYSGGSDGSQKIDLSTAQQAKTADTTGVSSIYDKALLSPEANQTIQNNSSAWKQAQVNGDAATKEVTHVVAQKERAKAFYSGGDDGSQYIPFNAQQTAEQKVTNASDSLKPADTTSQKNLLSQWLSAAQQQTNLQVDNATNQNVMALEKSQQEASDKYDTQRQQITTAEAKAKDNAALYAEMRGDKGGIGQAQYSNIENTAAQNRQQVNLAQTKLANDTAQQISTLRAQGEYQKADKLLSLTQTYLSKLMSMEQWAAEYNMSVTQLQSQIAQWQANYEYQKSRDVVSDNQWQTSFDYQNTRDTVSDDQWQQNFDLTKEQIAIENAQWQQNMGFKISQASISNSYKAANLQIAKEKLQLQMSKAASSKSDGGVTTAQLRSTAMTILKNGGTLTDEQLAATGMTKQQMYNYAQQHAYDGDYSDESSSR